MMTWTDSRPRPLVDVIAQCGECCAQWPGWTMTLSDEWPIGALHFPIELPARCDACGELVSKVDLRIRPIPKDEQSWLNPAALMTHHDYRTIDADGEGILARSDDAARWFCDTCDHARHNGRCGVRDCRCYRLTAGDVAALLVVGGVVYLIATYAMQLMGVR